MAKLKVIQFDGSFKGEIQPAKHLLLKKAVIQPVFDAILLEQAACRQGTHSTLTKGEVSGGGKKPYKQKHTGKARQGSIRNPHYVGGGVVFGPKPNRNYKLKLNKKAYQLALTSAFAQKLNNNQVIVAEAKLFEQTNAKTKKMLTFLKNAKLTEQKLLFVIDTISKPLLLSTNNLKQIVVKQFNKVSVRDLLLAKTIIIEKAAFTKLEERLK